MGPAEVISSRPETPACQKLEAKVREGGKNLGGSQGSGQTPVEPGVRGVGCMRRGTVGRKGPGKAWMVVGAEV